MGPSTLRLLAQHHLPDYRKYRTSPFPFYHKPKHNYPLTGTDVHGEEESLAAQREEESFRFSGWRDFKTAYRFKVVWDGDGVAFSGRLRSLLKSSSAVMKTRMFREAMDELLIPWVHYIPLSLKLAEVHNILLYFFGTSALGFHRNIAASLSHDEELERIAQNGQEFANQCMGRVEMMLYTYRVVLEWARITSDDRDSLKFELPPSPDL
ncbi:glycosyltransferase family 90 protein [Atractiella rhizophila]|nr:glycosyltransferase family 90 protein [Atractiella rhizophila]